MMCGVRICIAIRIGHFISYILTIRRIRWCVLKSKIDPLYIYSEELVYLFRELTKNKYESPTNADIYEMFLLGQPQNKIGLLI